MYIDLKTIIKRETQKHAHTHTHTHTHTHRVKDSNTPGCSHEEIDSDSDSGYNGIVLIELNLPCVTILKAGEKYQNNCVTKSCVTKSELILLIARQANKLRDQVLEQGMASLLRKAADLECSALESQRTNPTRV